MYNMFRPPPQSPPAKDLATPTMILTPPTATTSTQKSKSAKKIKTLLKTQEQPVSSSSSLTSLQPFLRGLETDRNSIDALLLGAGVKREFDLGKRSPVKIESGEIKKSPAKMSAFHMFCDQYKQYVQNEFLKVSIEFKTA